MRISPTGLADACEEQGRGEGAAELQRMVAMLGGITAVGPTAALGHDLRPGDPTYRFREYEDIVNRSSQVKQVYQWPNIANAIIFANIRNGLNGFQFSYDIPPDEIQVVVQAYAAANAATYCRAPPCG